MGIYFYLDWRKESAINWSCFWLWNEDYLDIWTEFDKHIQRFQLPGKMIAFLFFITKSKYLAA